MNSSKAGGFNGILALLESATSVVLMSGDSTQVRRDFANSCDWRFRLASRDSGVLTPRA